MFRVTLGENTLLPEKWNTNSARNSLVCFLEAKEEITLPRAAIKGQGEAEGGSAHIKPPKNTNSNGEMSARWHLYGKQKWPSMVL